MSRSSGLTACALLVGAFIITARAEEKRPAQQRLDRYGDPLPDGAALRLGTVRLRSPSEMEWVRFLPDGKTILTCGRPGSVDLWDLRDGRRNSSLFLDDLDAKTDIALSPDGRRLAVTTGKGLAVWDLPDRKRVYRVAPEDEPVQMRAVSFSPDGRLLATMGYDRALRLWNAGTGEEFLAVRMTGRCDRDSPLVFSPDGRLFASSDDEAIYVWDLEAADRAGRFTFEKRHVARPYAFTADGKHLICAEYRETGVGALCDWEIVLRDPATGKKARSWSAGRERRYCGCALRLSPDGKWLLGAYPTKLVTWDMAAGKVVRTILSDGIEDWRRYPHGIDVSADGALIASCLSSHTVGVWEAATGRRRLEFADAHDDNVQALCVSPDGRLVATGDRRGSIRLWELPLAKHVRELRLSEYDVGSVAFSRDGKLLIGGGTMLDHERLHFGGVVRIWQVEGGKLLHEIKFERRVQHVATSPDGKKLAVAACQLVVEEDVKGPPSAVHVIDLADPKVIEKSLEIAFGAALVFSADGTSLSAVDERATRPGMLVLCQWSLASGKKEGEHMVVSQDDEAVYDTSGEIAALALGTRITLRQVTTGKELLSIPLPKWERLRMAFSPDRRLLAKAASPDGSDDQGRIKVFDTATGRLLLTRTSDRALWRTSIVFSPDGKSLIVGSGQGTALVYDVREAYEKLGPAEKK